MSNALNRVISAGEHVVIESDYFDNVTLPIEQRIFICSGDGYGAKPYLMGSALMGKFKDPSNRAERVHGWAIDVAATNALHAKIAQEQHAVDARSAGEP